MYKIILCLTALIASGWSQHQHGLPCSSAQDCDFIENAVCLDIGVCACLPGYQPLGGFTSCVPASPYYGSPCVQDFQCSRMQFGYECGPDGVCSCQEGLRYVQGLCRSGGEFGTACTTNAHCLGLADPFSLACVAGTCACAPGYYERQFGECRRITNAPGGTCFLQSDCQFENAACDVATLTCITEDPESGETGAEAALRSSAPAAKAPAAAPAAPAEKAAEETGAADGTATTTRQHGAACATNADCAGAFECSPQSHCICPLGAFPSSDGSTCLAELGQPPINGECGHIFAKVDPETNLCRCQNNFLYLTGMRECLRPNPVFDWFCLSDMSCRTFGNAGVCVVTIPELGITECDCNAEISIRDDENFVCTLIGVIGDTCESDLECPNNTICVEAETEETEEIEETEDAEETEEVRVCGCPPNTILLPAEQICLNDNLGLNEDCNLDVECGVANSACINGACSCIDGFFNNEGVCRPALGGPCSVSADCDVEHSQCEQLACTCHDESVQVDGECLLHAEGLEAECTNDVQCHPSIGPAGICLEETCHCSEGFHFRNGLCRESVAINGRCATTGMCFLASDLERSICRNQQCVCDWDYEYDPETHACVYPSYLSSSSIFGVGFTVIVIPLTVIFFSKIIH